PPNLRSGEADLDAEDLFDAAGDGAGGGVEAVRDLDAVQVDDRVVATLGEDVDEHREGEGIVQKAILGVDQREAGDRVPEDDRHDLLAHEPDDVGKEFAVLELVTVETLHQLLPGVNDDFLGDRNYAQRVVRGGIQLERALVLELLENVLLDLLDLTLGVDRVVME